MKIPSALKSTIVPFLLAVVPLSAFAESKDDYINRLAALELEDLLNQEISSVLRKEQPIAKAPSAVYVLTGEDVRRSGATSIPEALRLVPGITVIRTNANNWSITARGFDSNGSAKLLVLIDGRSVYTPLFSGVFWDVQDVVLEDIERIEVIRGPGAVSWGENAVNGVINILTKKSADTQGGLISGGGGKEEQGFGTIRYGGKVGENTSYRVYTKYFNRDNFRESPIPGEQHGSAEDDWDMFRGGFRLDSTLSPKDAVTFQGDIYNGNTSQKTDLLRSFTAPFSELIRNETDLTGGNLLFRFTRDISATSQVKLQTYYDRTERHNEVFGEDRDTFDIDLQHHLLLSPRHDFVYGANYRLSSDDIEGSFPIQFSPSSRTDYLANAFVQDEITLIPEKLAIIPGSKIGYNEYSGFEYQPALKVVWTPKDNNTIWGSVSRAVRMPARIDEDLRANVRPSGVGADGSPLVPVLFGTRGFDGEDLLAYELGFRREFAKQATLDIATFYHRYDNLLSLEPGAPFAESNPLPAHTVLPFSIDNKVEGDTYGAEIAATWRPFSGVTLLPSYSYTEVQLSKDHDSLDPVFKGVERATPHHQAVLRAHFDLPGDFELDPILYYVDSIPNSDVSSYLRTDLRLGWRVNSDLTLDFVVQNLFDDGHHEAGRARPVEIERCVFGKVTYRFD